MTDNFFQVPETPPYEGQEDIAYDMSSDVWHRPGTIDLFSVAETRNYRLLGISPGEIVLDFGGHIGAFTRWALKRGAIRALAVEAEERNYELLLANLFQYPERGRALHAAVTDTADDGSTIQIHVPIAAKKKIHLDIATARGLNSIAPEFRFDSEFRSEPVTAVSAVRLVREEQPTFLKVDIESAEHFLDWPGILAAGGTRLRKIAIEYHWFTPERLASCEHIHHNILDAGFGITRAPFFSAASKEHTSLGLYQRS